MRGVAGIGKSTLIQRYVLKWPKNEILNGKNNEQKIDFLFFFECRELNTITNISCFEGLLKVKYPEFFDLIDLSHLQNITDRIMIIVDGLDDLQGIYNETQNETFPMTEMMKRMIYPKSDILKGHKTIVGGRHNACESVESKMKRTLIKIVEVCGFSENKSIEFIYRFFQSDIQQSQRYDKMIKYPCDVKCSYTVVSHLFAVLRRFRNRKNFSYRTFCLWFVGFPEESCPWTRKPWKHWFKLLCDVPTYWGNRVFTIHFVCEDIWTRW